MITDYENVALDQIADQLDGVEWTPDTLDAIATIIVATGRQVRDPSEMLASCFARGKIGE